MPPWRCHKDDHRLVMHLLCRWFPFLCKPKPVPRRAVCVNVPSPSPSVDAALSRIKPSMVRTSLYVDQWEHEAERYRPEFSRIVRHYEALGCRVLVVVTGDNLNLTLDQAISIFVRVTGELLALHPNVIVQVCNEADGDNPFNGNVLAAPMGWFFGRDESATQWERGRRYGWMLSDVLNAHGRSMIVTTGITREPGEFLAGMRDSLGGGRTPKAVCLHNYSAPLGPNLAKLVTLAGGSIPIWITETGWPLTNGGESEQEKQIRSLLDQFDRDRRVAELFAFTLSADAAEPCALLRPDGSFRPAGALLIR